MRERPAPLGAGHGSADVLDGVLRGGQGGSGAGDRGAGVVDVGVRGVDAGIGLGIDDGVTHGCSPGCAAGAAGWCPSGIRQLEELLAPVED